MLSRQTLACLRPSHCFLRTVHSSVACRNAPTALNNILAGGPAPAVQVRKVSLRGIELADGLVLPSACIFLDGQVFLWDFSPILKGKWEAEKFEVFDVVIPKPEILILGTGKSAIHPPPAIRSYLNGIGVQLDVMDTWNACTTYNLLTEEGRRVAAALLPLNPQAWRKEM